MANRTKRISRAQFNSGEYELPKEVSFLGQEQYVAIVFRASNEKYTTTVELTPTHVRRLLKVMNQSKQQAERIIQLEEEAKAMQDELAMSKEEIEISRNELAIVEQVNARLLKNIEEEDNSKPVSRSPKSHLANAIERGTDFSTRPLQGGLAGATKK